MIEQQVNVDQLSIHTIRTLSIDAIEKVGSGHPEFGHTPGVDATTGPLGQGIAMAGANMSVTMVLF